ncbi:MAG: hypothetical protein Ct9H300mP28_30670 [Pseudomonadota bacterium]|nr:MAG: hypothetical protein Ct9H300mP28_30670 [Pseudomonadota bacterium]
MELLPQAILCCKFPDWKILKKGGHAVDAGVKRSIRLKCCRANVHGVGGEVFALVYDLTKKSGGPKGSGKSSIKTDINKLEEIGFWVPFPFWVGSTLDWLKCPGVCRCMGPASGKIWGLFLDTVLAPAVDYAQDGFGGF